MPLPPSPQRLPPEARRRPGRWIAAAAILGVLLAVSLACTSAAPPPPSVREPAQRALVPLALEPADRPYLLDPLEGYSPKTDAGLGDAQSRGQLTAAWRNLVDTGDTDGAAKAAAEMLAATPDFLPAQVLAAQVEFAAGDNTHVVARLLPVGDALPTYTASQLLIGRAAERLGDIALSYSAYRSVAARSPLALKRAGELHPRAMEIVYHRLDEALRLAKLDEAQKQLALLQGWGPSETITLEATRKVARARNDLPTELAAVKEIAGRTPGDRQLMERRAELELAVGDPSAGLQIVQGLAAANPKDLVLAQKLEAAKFRWRLSQLPKDVQTIASKPELNRGDYAVLLYWLVPQVRNSRPSAGKIATDVLDSTHQEEIVRVVNLGLMDVDATQHRFYPGSPLRRGQALRIVLRMLARFNAASCANGNVEGGDVCDVAQGCDLMASSDDCDAAAALSGAGGVEILRRSLKLLGGA
jgi:tetratricopeptide (TPR) repeat protein